MKFQIIALFGMVGLLFASCTTSTEAPKSIDLVKLKVDIQKMEDAYAAAEKAKNADGVVAYYSEDAISYNRGEEPTSGKAAIRDRIAKKMAKDTTQNINVYKVVDLSAEANMAVEIGSWTVLDPSGKEMDKGYYLSYFQLRDGKYLCVRDMNVSSMPDKKDK